jgi:hypothetical protein
MPGQVPVTVGELITIGSVVFGAGGLWFQVRSFSRRLDKTGERVTKLDDYVRNGGMEDKYVTRREYEAIHADRDPPQ